MKAVVWECAGLCPVGPSGCGKLASRLDFVHFLSLTLWPKFTFVAVVNTFEIVGICAASLVNVAAVPYSRSKPRHLKYIRPVFCFRPSSEVRVCWILHEFAWRFCDALVFQNATWTHPSRPSCRCQEFISNCRNGCLKRSRWHHPQQLRCLFQCVSIQAL